MEQLRLFARKKRASINANDEAQTQAVAVMLKPLMIQDHDQSPSGSVGLRRQTCAASIVTVNKHVQYFPEAHVRS